MRNRTRILLVVLALLIVGVAVAGPNTPDPRDAVMVLPVATNTDGGLTPLSVNSAGSLNVNATVSANALQNVQGVDGGYPIAVAGSFSLSGTTSVQGVDGGYPVTVLDYSSANTSGAEALVTCGTSTASGVPTTPLAGRRDIFMQNQGSVNAMIGLVPTNSFGAQLAPGASMTWHCSNTACPLQCISSSASVSCSLYVAEIK